MIRTTQRIFLRNFFSTCGAFLLLCSVASSVFGQQTFTSGSTGALGAFNPTQSTEVVLPDDGVLNYTTINIPANVTVTFKRNARNTPVVMLASGDVTIAGTINISGAAYNSPSTVNAGLSGRTSGGSGGPGGFNGGGGGSVIDRLRDAISGDGPGGGGGGKTSADGTTNSPGGGGGFFAKGGNSFGGFAPGSGGNRYGSLRLLPLIGGSGGGGSSALTTQAGFGGGGGGGAILIASSGKILFQSGQIIANGGVGFSSNLPLASGGGAGGAIKLMATTVAGNPNLQVSGGQGYSFNGNLSNSGSPGYVRVEAINYENYAPSISPNLSVFSAGLPTTVTPANLPQLRITAVAGTNAPTTPNGSFFKAPDIILPSSQASPVTVGLAGTNIPTGIVVKVTATGETGTPTTVDSTALAGTAAASTATANVTLAPGYNLINATVSVDVQLLAQNNRPMYLEGERIKRVEVAASSDGKSAITFITETGKQIKGE